MSTTSGKNYVIEFTRTSEAYWDESAAAKVDQHKEVMQAIKDAGYNATLMVIQVGVRGGVPASTMANMKTLGISRQAAKKLARRLGRHSAAAGVKSWHTRRKLGKPGGKEGHHSMTRRSQVVLPNTTSACTYDAHGAYAKTKALERRLEHKKAAERNRSGGAEGS